MKENTPSFADNIRTRILGDIPIRKIWKLRQKALISSGALKKWYVIRYMRCVRKYGAYIPITAKIGSMPDFPHHLHGIFISAEAVIGSNCTLFQQVTIGSNTAIGSKSNGSPIIGDNVIIGSGAKIIGGVKIGNNVRIGANCIVVKDVPDNATVVLPSPRIILREEPRDNRFISITDK